MATINRKTRNQSNLNSTRIRFHVKNRSECRKSVKRPVENLRYGQEKKTVLKNFNLYFVVVLETEGSENDVETTQPTIRENTNKRIAIPRNRPTKIIRKPVFSYDPRHKERAAMIAGMVVFNVLGMFLYWLV